MKRRQPIALFTLLALGLLALLVPGQWVREPAPSAAAGIETGSPASRTVDAAGNLDGILPGLKKLNAERHSLVGSGGARALSAQGPWNVIAFDARSLAWPVSAERTQADAFFGREGATGPPAQTRT